MSEVHKNRIEENKSDIEWLRSQLIFAFDSATGLHNEDYLPSTRMCMPSSTEKLRLDEIGYIDQIAQILREEHKII